MSFQKSKLALAVAAAAGLTFSSGAFATNGIIQAGNGMCAHGFGGAGLSNACEASSGADNPALIGQTGDSISVGFSIFMPDRQVEVPILGLTQRSDNNTYAIPQISFTSRINNDMSWGIMAYAMGGMNTTYRNGFIVPASSVDLSGMIVAPTLSYTPVKGLSIGASLLIGYENFRVQNLFGSGLFDEGSTMAYGVKLGADWKVTNGISIGAMIQPKMSAGELSFFDNFLTGFGFTGDSALVLPNEFGVGAKFALGSKADLIADILYYQWSSVDVFDFFGWEDQIVFKVGGEYRPTEKLALRAGLNYGKSPIQADTLAANGAGSAVALNWAFPAVSEWHITVGMGYKMDKNMSISGYYLHSPRTTIEDSLAFSGLAISMTQNAFGLGIDYRSK